MAISNIMRYLDTSTIRFVIGYSTPRLKCPLVKSFTGSATSLPSLKEAAKASNIFFVSSFPTLVKERRREVRFSSFTASSLPNKDNGRGFKIVLYQKLQCAFKGSPAPVRSFIKSCSLLAVHPFNVFTTHWAETIIGACP